MNQPRNKFIDRFKTQIIKPSNRTIGEKTDRQMQANSSAHIRSINSKHSNSKSVDIHEIIVTNLEKHIAYLEKKLKDAEQQNQRTKNLLDTAQKKIVEHDIQQQGFIDQIEGLHECLRKTEKNYDMVRSDYENLVLKQKMEKLSVQVNQKKQAFAKLQLKHQYKKGRFSAAFLPTSFGSPDRYKQIDQKQYTPIIREYEGKNIEQKSVISKKVYENCISHQYNLIKMENDQLVKRVHELEEKNQKIHQSLNQKQKTHSQLIQDQQKVLREQIQSLSNENQQLKTKIEQILMENKRFLSKITQNQQKMIEISMVLNQRSSSASSLQHNSIKIQKQMQTELLFNPEAKSHTDTKQLEERIQMLTKKLQQKDEQVRQEQMEHNLQVKDLYNLMKKCNEEISEIQDSRQENNPQQNGQILEHQSLKQQKQSLVSQDLNRVTSESQEKQKISNELIQQ